MGKFIEDFKAFALKGNVVDMAIGVIVGGAFGKIVTSLVNDVLMPLISVITGGNSFSSLKWVITPEKLGPDGVVLVEECALKYGMFIQNIVDFFIIAFCIFVTMRYAMKLTRKKKEEEAAAPAPEPSAEEKLLTEIRDLLNKEK